MSSDPSAMTLDATPAAQQWTPQGREDEIYARYKPRIDRHVRRLLGSDSDREDVAQDALVAVLQGVRSVRDTTRLDAWVAQVTVNTVHSALRQRRYRRLVSLDTLPECQLPVFWTNQDTRDLARRLLGLVERLPAPDQRLLMSYWLSPLTVESIASELGCSLATLQRRLRRARKRFDSLIRHDGMIATSVPGFPLALTPRASTGSERGTSLARRRSRRCAA